MPSWEPGRAPPPSKKVHLEIEGLPKLMWAPHQSPIIRLVSAAVIVFAVFGAGVGVTLLSIETSCAERATLETFDSSMGISVPPSQITHLTAYSTSRMVRSVPSYAGTIRENTTLAAGVTTILAEDGSEEFKVTTEVILDAPFGEFAIASPGAPISERSFRLVFTNISGAKTVLIPFGISAAALRSNATLLTLRPNFFYVQHFPAPRRRLSVAGDIGHFDTFASTVSGRLEAHSREHQEQLEQVINPILHSYGNAAKQDAQEAWTKFGGLWHGPPSNHSAGRQLHVLREIGHYIGSKIGDKVRAGRPLVAFGFPPPSPPAPTRASTWMGPPRLTRARLPRRLERISARPSVAMSVKRSAAPSEEPWPVQSVQTLALSRGVRWARGPAVRLGTNSETSSEGGLARTSVRMSPTKCEMAGSGV